MTIDRTLLKSHVKMSTAIIPTVRDIGGTFLEQNVTGSCNDHADRLHVRRQAVLKREAKPGNVLLNKQVNKTVGSPAEGAVTKNKRTASFVMARSVLNNGALIS